VTAEATRARTGRMTGLVALVVVLVGVLVFGVASYAHSDNGGDQCSKPISERVGGWACPGP
jgi:hypothetical protein